MAQSYILCGGNPVVLALLNMSAKLVYSAGNFC